MDRPAPAEEPGQIVAVHRAYFEAGAEVATTASYQASIEGLIAPGPTRNRAPADPAQRHRRPGGREAVADDQAGALVAASVGPYGAFLADGSEYRGRYGVSAATLRDFHAPRLELLA